MPEWNYAKTLFQQHLKAAEGRKVFVFGVGGFGSIIAYILKQAGWPVDGFVDHIRTDPKVTILPPEIFFNEYGAERPFLIIAPISQPGMKRIVAECVSNGYIHYRDFITFASMKSPNEYSIEIIDPDESGQHISVANFDQVIEKMVAEDPGIWDLELFNRLNPLVHPKLPEIMSLVRDQGIFPVVYFPLDAIERRNVLLDCPAGIVRIQAKTGQVYKQTEEFLANLSHHYEDMGFRFLITVEFELYKETDPQDYKKMAGFCSDLNISLKPVLGYHRSLDELYLFASEGCSEVISGKIMFDNQLLRLPDALAKARMQKERSCGYRRSFVIDSKKRLRFCYNWKEGVSGDYLQIPLADMIADRDKSVLCGKCREHGLHRYPSLHISSILLKKIIEELQLCGIMERP